MNTCTHSCTQDEYIQNTFVDILMLAEKCVSIFVVSTYLQIGCICSTRNNTDMKSLITSIPNYFTYFMIISPSNCIYLNTDSFHLKQNFNSYSRMIELTRQLNQNTVTNLRQIYIQNMKNWKFKTMKRKSTKMIFCLHLNSLCHILYPQ